MMLKSYKGRRIPQPEFECAENEPRAVIIRRQVELRFEGTRRFLAATSPSLSLLLLTFGLLTFGLLICLSCEL